MYKNFCFSYYGLFLAFVINLNQSTWIWATNEIQPISKSSDHLTALNVPSSLSRNPKSVNVVDSQDNKASNSNNNDKLESINKNFKINKNTIIKTHDSRGLGAKYLNETELTSNEECMLWCWNTSNCNLAVFEEKTRGSCYLFDCGTIQDFKCRFASHTFYTSSILQTNRNSYLLNEWKSQASQESDLVGLKGKPLPVEPSDGRQSDASKIVDEVPHHLNNNKINVIQETNLNNYPTEKTPMSLKKVSKCRHYQFECRNNSECIAIYNVCDGIAQCSDGSDEALELECHKSRMNINLNGKNIVEFDTGTNGGGNLDLKAQQQQPKIISSGVFNQPPYSGQPDSSQVLAKSNPLLKYSSNLNYNYPKSANNNYNNNEENSYHHGGGGLQPDYQNGYVFPNWNQYSMTNGNPEAKQLGIITNEPTNNDQTSSNNLYWPSFKYQSPQSTLNGVENYIQQQQQPQRSSNNDNGAAVVLYNVPVLGNEIRSKTDYSILQQQQQQHRIAHNPTIINDPKTDSQVRMHLMNVSSILDHNGKTLSGDDVQQPSHALSSSTNNKTIGYSMISNQEKLSIRTPNLVAITYMHDNQAQQQPNGRETNSAVIALTLGLFITCILIVIVGCRMKSFKKRIARRGRSLAHDADYLINGMYL